MNSIDYCNHLYDNTTEGFLQIKQIINDGNHEVKIYNIDNSNLREVILKLDKSYDTYLTINTHFIPQGTIQTIRQFRALYIDLDIKKYSKLETINKVNRLVKRKVIPQPTMIVDSGRGLHIYWRIYNAPYQALYTWQQIEDYLYYKLKNLGSDLKATDGARILRIPNTINSRNNEECKILFLDENIIYSMYDLRKNYLGYKKTKPKEKYQIEFEETKKITKNISYFFNSYTLHSARAKDLQTLCRLRNYNVIGYRNMIIHCYAYWLALTIRDKEEVEKKVIELNNAFTEPLKDNEILNTIKCIYKAVDKFILYENHVREGKRIKVKKGSMDKYGYWYKNSTLIERLDITEKEQEHLSSIISRKEKYRRNKDNIIEYQKEYGKIKRRNENGLTKRQQQKEDTVKAVKKYKELGMTQKEVSEKINKSIRTVKSYWNL